jgi:hypothetical protein
VSTNQDIPLHGSAEAQTAEIVRCRVDDMHIASRKAFENEGGCPYCKLTQAERIAALTREEAAERQARRDAR